MAKEQVMIERQILDDMDPDTSYLDQGEEWAERKAQYEAGDFHFVGVRAVAKIRTPFGNDWIESEMSTPGCWGIESDSGEDYLNEIFEEERAMLLDMLEALRN